MKSTEKYLGFSGNLGYYVLCTLVCQYLVGPCAAMVAKLTSKIADIIAVHHTPEIVTFYASHWLWFNLLAGVIAGFSVYTIWPSVLIFGVWIPSSVALIHKIIAEPRSVLLRRTFGVSIRYFLSGGCSDVSLKNLYISNQCADQFFYSLPFYAAMGFSLGAFSHYLYLACYSRAQKKPVP